MNEIQVRVVREPCDECPWKGRFDLRPGRLKDLRETIRDDDRVFICHKTTVKFETNDVADDKGDEGAAVCAGWADSFPEDWPWLLRYAESEGVIRRVAPLLDESA